VLSGKVVLAQGRIVSPLEVLDFNLRGEKPQRRAGLHLFRLTDSPFKELRFDVDIPSRGRLEIDNNVAKGSVRPDLRLTGTGEVPTLSGTLYIDRTLVKLPANDLTVRSGSVRFDEADPFFPRLEIKADARIKGYDVLVTVLGPYDKPEVVLSSTPPLPAEDLIVLVLAGQTPGASASRTGRAAVQSVAVYLAKDYLARWLSSTDPDDDASWFDRFDFQTGRDITRSGAETLEASFRFDEDRFIERDAIYLTAESDQYDFINFGVRLVFRFP
jgi:translocation and assembly module TamB